MSNSFIDHNSESMGRIDPEPKRVKLNQSDYSAIVSHTRAHGKNMITIPHRHNTDHLHLAMDIPHHFKGDSIIREVPDGSFVGDDSIIEPDVIINNCSISDGVRIGDQCKLSNCYVGLACEAGDGVEFNSCEIQLFLTAQSAKINNSILMGMASIDELTVGDNNIIYPGSSIKLVPSVGAGNTFIGEDIEVVPSSAHDNNAFLPADNYRVNYYDINHEIVNNKGQVPYFNTIRADIDGVVSEHKASVDKRQQQKIEDKPEQEHKSSGPGIS